MFLFVADSCSFETEVNLKNGYISTLSVLSSMRKVNVLMAGTGGFHETDC